MNRSTVVAVLIVLALAAAGCEEGRRAPPKTLVRVLHAAPSLDEITFRRVEASAGTFTYRAGSAFSFDEDLYTFNVDAVSPANELDRKLTFSKQVLAGTEYLFVLLEAGGDLEPLVIEVPALESSSVDPRIIVVHTGEALPAVDVYVEPPGTDLAAAQPLGSVGFGDFLEPQSLAPGDYRVTFTAAGDPQQVLLSSTALPFGAGESNLLAVVDMAGESSVPFGLVRLLDSAQTFVDEDVQSTVRAINAAADRGERDVVIDGEFGAPLLPALPFAEVSDYVELERGERDLVVTPAGNPGALELEETVTAVGGRAHLLLIAGDPGELDHRFVQEDQRRIGDRARVRFLNGANQFNGIDFYVVLPGTDLANLSNIPPRASLSAPGVSAQQPFPGGEFEIVLRRSGSTDVVAGPLTLNLETGGIYGVLAVDGGAETAAEIVLFDDFE